MNPLSLICLSAALLICSVSGGPTDAERVSKLNEVRRGKRGGVLTFNIPHFRKYIEASPRSYSMIVLFVADPSICKPCRPMRQQLEKIAGEYYGGSQRSQASHPVYFASLSIGMEDRQFLGEYGIEHVPILYHFGPGKSQKFPATLQTRTSADSYQVEQSGIGANAMKMFINERTGSRLRAVRGDYTIPFAPVVRQLKPVIFLVVGLLAALSTFMGWYKQPMFWFVCCVIVYMYSIGGGHYTWINNSPFASVNGDGMTQYVADGSRNQYVAEGMFVSLTCGAITVIAISINELPKFVPNKGGQNLIGLSLAGVCFVCTTLLLGLYQLKMSSYLRYDA